MDNRIMDKSYIGWIWDFKGIKWILRWLIIRNFESSLNQHKKWGQIDTPIWPHSLSLLSTFLLLSPVNNPWFWQSYFWHKVYFDITRNKPHVWPCRGAFGESGDLLNWSGCARDRGNVGLVGRRDDPLSKFRTVRVGEGGYLLFGWAVNF
jgi:hypothetical protein